MIGVLPQRPLIETGTVAENISCFEADPKPEAISLAAKMAGVHGLICALPQSYETDLGQEPYVLSAGQMQRLALARALYAEPRYLFLDEPNALLDSVGERVLGQTLLRLKRKGVTIVMAVHRSGLLALADHVLQLDHGRVADFGPKAEVLGRLGMGGRRIELPILESSLPDLKDWLGSQFTRAGDQAFRHRAQIIGEELLKIACAECPADTLSFAEFAFGFLDQARCEVTMTKPMGQDLGHGVGAVRSNQSTAQGNLVHLTQDEVRLARVSQLAETLEVSSIDEQTRYRAILAAGIITAADSRENQAL
jgi:ABC-type multidrug transport system ATPase subunit